jgi:hypothetical protein
MKECIPTLQENLQKLIAEQKQNDYEQAYRFALAKLGDKTQYEYILDTFIPTRHFDSRFFSYFRDDRITWKYVDINYSSGKFYTIYSEGEKVPASIITMDVICPFIKDLPKELENPVFQSGGDQRFYKWEKKLYEWLMKNRDTIKFNYDGEKTLYIST